jgi:hypothetical protein
VSALPPISIPPLTVSFFHRHPEQQLGQFSFPRERLRPSDEDLKSLFRSKFSHSREI